MKFNKLQGYFIVAIVILAVSILLSNFAGAATKSTNTIGFVDMAQLQNELSDFQKLKDVAKDKQTEFNYLRGYLYTQQQNAVKDLQKQATTEKVGKSADEQAAIDKKLQEDTDKETKDINDQLQKEVDKLQKAMGEANEATLTKVRKLISIVAEEKRLTLVLEKNTCFYGADDITQDVIDKAKKQDAQTTGKTNNKGTTGTTGETTPTQK